MKCSRLRCLDLLRAEEKYVRVYALMSWRVRCCRALAPTLLGCCPASCWSRRSPFLGLPPPLPSCACQRRVPRSRTCLSCHNTKPTWRAMPGVWLRPLMWQLCPYVLWLSPSSYGCSLDLAAFPSVLWLSPSSYCGPAVLRTCCIADLPTAGLAWRKQRGTLSCTRLQNRARREQAAPAGVRVAAAEAC